MRFQTPLVPATLLKRYKRFLADVRLKDGREVTAHCPNPGGMQGLKDEGTRIWLEPNDDPTKKLKFGWRLVELADQNFACIDTGLANRIVKEALEQDQIPELTGYATIKPEVKYGQNSRIDFLLSGGASPDAYVEVKSVTLLRQGTKAEFPDSVTARGTKHLGELSAIFSQGHRAVMLYLLQRTDCTTFKIAANLDPKYAQAFDDARQAGVETLCYETNISPSEITLKQPIPIDPNPQSRT
jgi:sugar fermentation stimulation protein A